jgi:hypothetical protein
MNKLQNGRTTTTVAAALALLAAGLAGGWGLARWAEHGAAPSPGAAAPAERKVLYWYDPMVPTQKFDKPGKSPFMDMHLVPRYADEDGSAADAAGSIGVSPQAAQSLGLRLATAERAALGRSVDAVATVQLNERDVSIVQARAAGFVERVYAARAGRRGRRRRTAGRPAAPRVAGRAAGVPGGAGHRRRRAGRGRAAAPGAAGHAGGTHRAVQAGRQPIAITTVSAPAAA